MITDDEQHFRSALRKMVEEIPEIRIIGEADGVSATLLALEQTEVDLLFLDVEMGDGNGFDIINQLPENKYKIIFTTGHSRYAVQAFKYSAIDYLLKPIDATELKNAVDKVKSATYFEDMRQKFAALTANKNGFEKIALPGQYETILVDIKDIIRCQSESNYTWFYLKNGKNILVSKVLKDYEEILDPQGFFRVHKSHLVNLKTIHAYSGGEGGTLHLSDGTDIPVSRRRKKDLLQRLNAFIQESDS